MPGKCNVCNGITNISSEEVLTGLFVAFSCLLGIFSFSAPTQSQPRIVYGFIKIRCLNCPEI